MNNLDKYDDFVNTLSSAATERKYIAYNQTEGRYKVLNQKQTANDTTVLNTNDIEGMALKCFDFYKQHGDLEKMNTLATALGNYKARLNVSISNKWWFPIAKCLGFQSAKIENLSQIIDKTVIQGFKTEIHKLNRAEKELSEHAQSYNTLNAKYKAAAELELKSLEEELEIGNGKLKVLDEDGVKEKGSGITRRALLKSVELIQWKIRDVKKTLEDNDRHIAFVDDYMATSEAQKKSINNVMEYYKQNKQEISIDLKSAQSKEFEKLLKKLELEIAYKSLNSISLSLSMIRMSAIAKSYAEKYEDSPPRKTGDPIRSFESQVITKCEAEITKIENGDSGDSSSHAIAALRLMSELPPGENQNDLKERLRVAVDKTTLLNVGKKESQLRETLLYSSQKTCKQDLLNLHKENLLKPAINKLLIQAYLNPDETSSKEQLKVIRDYAEEIPELNAVWIGMENENDDFLVLIDRNYSLNTLKI